MLQRFQFSPDDYSAGQNTIVVTYKINKIIAKAGLKKAEEEWGEGSLLHEAWSGLPYSGS